MEATPIIISIIGTGIGIVGLTGLMARLLSSGINRQFNGIAQQFDGVGRQLDAVDGRLKRIETRLDDTNKRIDAIGRDIAELRDRTGTLEGTLSTFMRAGRSPNAA